MSADTPDVPGCRAYFKDVCPPCLSERTGGGRCDTPDVGLTEQERQSLIDAMDAVIEAGWTGLTPQHVGPVVERIVAARVAAERERAESTWDCGNFTEPVTCLSAGVAVTARCGRCRLRLALAEETVRLAALGGDAS